MTVTDYDINADNKKIELNELIVETVWRWHTAPVCPRALNPTGNTNMAE
jgi:hypothetical protein